MKQIFLSLCILVASARAATNRPAWSLPSTNNWSDAAKVIVTDDTNTWNVALGWLRTNYSRIPSNALFLTLTNYDAISSNALYTLLTNGVAVTSNGLFGVTTSLQLQITDVANDVTTLDTRATNIEANTNRWQQYGPQIAGNSNAIAALTNLVATNVVPLQPTVATLATNATAADLARAFNLLLASLENSRVLLAAKTPYWESDSGVSGSPASAWAAIVGGVTLSQGTSGWRPAVTASAFGSTTGLTFDGVDDVLTNTTRVINRTNAASLAVVFKTGSNVTNSASVLVSQADAAVANDWWEFGIASDGRIYIDNNASGTQHTVKGATVLSTNTSYSAVLTYDGTDFYLTLNGLEENPLTIESAGAFAWIGRVSGTSPVFSVGATTTSDGTVRPFNGTIGGVYFWNADLTQ